MNTNTNTPVLSATQRAALSAIESGTVRRIDVRFAGDSDEPAVMPRWFALGFPATVLLWIVLATLLVGCGVRPATHTTPAPTVECTTDTDCSARFGGEY
jgi:hypothetical protein